jgi:hypothetical protein
MPARYKSSRRCHRDDGCYSCGPCGNGGGLCGYKEYYYENGKGAKDVKRCGKNRRLVCGVNDGGQVKCVCR